ncbi:amp dependent CoA ligase [Lactifluus volemus]|nr:amp dependent CoA ligase [Lactifluus volemus]
MSEYVAEGILPVIPDDLTVPQFILDSSHSTRPIRKEAIPWLVDDTTGHQIGFEEIRSRVFGLANALSIKLKIRENDVVCVFSPNDVDYPIVIWAIQRLGAVVATANPASNAEELAHYISVSSSTIIVSHPDILLIAVKAAQQTDIPSDRIVLLGTPEQAAAPNLFGFDLHGLIAYGLSERTSFTERRLEPGEAKRKIGLLVFSSGTTGKPKAVEIPHYSLIANLIQLSTFLKINDGSIPWDERRFKPGDIGLCGESRCYIYAIVIGLHFQLYCGMTVIIAARFNFIRFLQSIVRYRVTHLMVVPPMAVLLAKHPEMQNYDMSVVRFLVCGAAPLSAELQEQVTRALPNAEIGQAYGMTETGGPVTFFPLLRRIGTPGGVGVFIPGVRARIVKPDGTLAKPGEQGELYVACPSVSLGYHNNEKATRETFIDGWVRTGDEAMINEKRELFVLDRVKEILKVRAFQVAPAELEGHLLRHTDIADVCVVGIPDEYSGELPFAFVVLSANAAKRAASGGAEKIKVDIIKHVADHKSKYKHLQGGVEFIDTIPRNPSGKLLRRILRDRARQLKVKQPPKL